MGNTLGFDELIQSVEEALLQRLSKFREPIRLYEPILYGLDKGGKRVRPVLLLMAVNLYKEDISAAMPAALAIEIFHNFTLLHDDIMDESDQRRGKRSVPSMYGVNQSLLSGDAMYALANSILTEAPQEKLFPLLQAFFKMNVEIMEGQQWDINFENQTRVSLDEYIEMIRLKTATLFATSLQMGGTIAEAPVEDIEALYKSGMNIGIAFQLRDDYLDVYGDSKTFGKPIGGDIAENKKTWLYIRAQQIAENKADLSWAAALKIEDKKEKYDAVKAVYDRYNLPEEGEKLIATYTQKALEELHTLKNVDSLVRGRLEKLYLKLAGRSV